MEYRRTSLFLFLGVLSLHSEIVPSGNKLTGRQELILVASGARAAPQFNGPLVTGILPGTPLVYAPAVSGARPISISAEDLPAGVTLDPRTGVFTGSLLASGRYPFTVTASNAFGKAKSEIIFICGNTLALTPPLGWNSYDSFGDSVVESEVISNALWLKNNLQPYG